MGKQSGSERTRGESKRVLNGLNEEQKLVNGSIFFQAHWADIQLRGFIFSYSFLGMSLAFGENTTLEMGFHLICCKTCGV